MSATLSALRLRSGVQVARPRPESAAARALLEALDAILAIDAEEYPRTVALARDAYGNAAPTSEAEREECREALRWFWSSAQPTRWEERLLDGWRYRGGDWWGFNGTLMGAGAFVAPEASFRALEYLLTKLPTDARDGILNQHWAYLRERGLNVNAKAPDERSPLETFAEHPETVALLLHRMDADPLLAYGPLRMRFDTDAPVLKALELLEDKLGLDNDQRVTQGASPDQLTRPMSRLRIPA